ncbi:MAG TPA: hypothetical protein VFG58_08225 [Solirubrobacterales bacterium]|nr:hypothetical protein [Solirubrobacterales bacterium]
MPLTGEEIRTNLTRFVAHWSVRDGYERGEAQTFLTELFACYGKRLPTWRSSSSSRQAASSI